MLLADRHQKILEMLKKQGSVRTAELSEIFETSRQTINSDINQLDKLGKLTKVHGGAVRAQGGKEPSIQYREISYLEEKRIIAQYAASFIEEGDSIYLDIGTTVRAMTPFLKEFNDLTIITNAIGLAYELGRDTELDIILAGGRIRNRELAASGTHALKIVENYYVDKAFIGVGGVTIDSGITDYYLDEAEIRKKCSKIRAQSSLYSTTLNWESMHWLKWPIWRLLIILFLAISKMKTF